MDNQTFKADGGKQRLSLFEQGFPHAIAAVQATMDYGAEKYEAHSWRNVSMQRYNDAARRHRNARDQVFARTGSFSAAQLSTDGESALLHLAHEAFCIMAQLETALIELHGSGVDWRSYLKYNKPPTAHKTSDAQSLNALLRSSFSGST